MYSCSPFSSLQLGGGTYIIHSFKEEKVLEASTSLMQIISELEMKMRLLGGKGQFEHSVFSQILSAAGKMLGANIQMSRVSFTVILLCSTPKS